MNSLKILVLFGAIFSVATAADDVIDTVIVATSNCEYCGMTFTGTISIKVRVNFIKLLAEVPGFAREAKENYVIEIIISI